MSQPTHPPDEALRALEDELLALRPADPSSGLRDRIFAALQEPHSADGEISTESATTLTPPGRGWFGWVPLAAAAAVAMLAVVLFPSPKAGENLADRDSTLTSPDPSAPAVAYHRDEAVPASWKPVSSDSRLEQVGYDGLRTDERATYRQIRTRSMERRTFIDPTDGTTVEVVFPRENIHLVPVTPE